MGQTLDKQAMKALRASRKVYIDRARHNIQETNTILAAIREQIAGQAKTIPQISQALGMDTARVLLFVSALKKYGEVNEGPKEGDYFTYGLAR